MYLHSSMMLINFHSNLFGGPCVGLCLKSKFFSEFSLKKIISSFQGMLVSVPFIAATVLIYILLPELHNLHGNCLMCYLFCLGIGYSFTAWIKLDEWNYVLPILCSTCGYFMYFFLLSAFLWSNVISFDLWQNLR